MLNIDSKNKKYYKIFFVISIILLLVSHINEGLWNIGDDLYFKDAIATLGNGSLIEYLKYRYVTWSGRVIVEALMVSIMNYEVIWRILNSVMIYILLYSMYKFVEDKQINSVKEDMYIKILVFSSIFLLDLEVYKWSISWVTGSFNYLWPMALGVFSIIPFKKSIFNEDYNKSTYVFFFLASIIACNTEQVAAFTICFAMISNIWTYIRYKKIDIILIVHNLFMIAISLILFTAPGNGVRYNAEVINWYPDFDTLTAIEKVYRGLILLINHLFNNYNVVILMICVLISVLIWKKYNDKVIKFISLLPLVSIGAYNLTLKNYVSSIPHMGIEYNNLVDFSVRNHLSALIFLGILIILPYLIYLVFDSIDSCMINVVLYLAAICCGLVISFSPTMYASGARVFYCTDIILLIIMCNLLRKLFIEKENYFKYIMYTLLGISIINYIIFTIL